MALVASRFGGMKPMLADEFLGLRNAKWAEDCDFMSGELRPLNRNRFVIHAGADDRGFVPIRMAEGSYKGTPGPARWVQAHGRHIYTAGEGGARWVDDDDPEDRDFPFGTLPDLFSEWTVGGSAFTPRLTRSGTTPQPEDATYFYALSVAHAQNGDEGGLSMAASIQAGAANSVSVSVPSAAVTALRALLADQDIENLEVRIYRSVAGDYLLAHRAPLPADGDALSWTDDLTPDTDGAPVRFLWPLESTKLPPAARNVILHPNGFLACHDDDTIYLSDPLATSQFPESHRIRFIEETIVNIEEYLNRIIIFFRDAPHKVLELSVPGAPQRLISPESAYPCISGDSVAKVANGIIYAGREGLYVTDGYQSRLLAPDLFDYTSFLPYGPESVRVFGGGHEFIMVSQSRGAFYFKRDGNMTALSEAVTDAVFHENAWWFLTDGRLEKAFAGNAPRRMTWESGRVYLARPTAFRSMRLLGDYVREDTPALAGGLGADMFMGELPLGESPIEEVTIDARTETRVTLKFDGKRKYRIRNPARSDRHFMMPLGVFRDTGDVGVILEGNASVKQAVIAERERVQDYVTGPGLSQ